MPWPPPPSRARTRVACAVAAKFGIGAGGPDVPRELHVVWMQGESALPPALAAILKDNRALAQRHGWRVRVWSAALVAALLEMHGETAWAARFAELAAASSVHAAADYARYCLAYLKGGLVLDADARVLTDPFAVIEAAARRVSEGRVGHGGVTVLGRTPLSHLSARLLTLGACVEHLSTAVIATSPSRAVWRVFIDSIPRVAPARLTDAAPPFGSLAAAALGGGEMAGVLAAQRTTGSIYFTDFWLRAAARGDAVVLPAAVFEPCRLDGKVCDVTPDTLVLHARSMSWLPSRTLALARAMSWHGGGASAAAGIGLVVVLLLALLAFVLMRGVRGVRGGEAAAR